jgi:hypothetical protein
MWIQSATVSDTVLAHCVNVAHVALGVVLSPLGVHSDVGHIIGLHGTVEKDYR